MYARAGLALAAGALASGCAVMSGVTAAPDGQALHGVEFHALTTAPMEAMGEGGPNVASLSYRQIGDERKTSFALGWMHVVDVGHAAVFGRLMVELLGREQLADGDHTRTLSPTFEIGIAPFGHGACLSVAGTWDVRIPDPDRGMVGAFFGWCGLGGKFKIK